MRRRLIGFIPCYNESDIIEDVLRYYESTGVPLVFIDNGSTDGSGEIAQRYLKREVLEYVRHETEEYDLKEMLNLCLTVVERHAPEWIMHIDSDLFSEPGPGFANFHDHVSDAEAQGCNVIDFEEYVFLPTTADDSDETNVYTRMKYYSLRAPGEAEQPTEC